MNRVPPNRGQYKEEAEEYRQLAISWEASAEAL